jgi:hypothetical protein
MKKKLYQEIASEVQAYKSCIESNNTEWRDNWHARLQHIQQSILPSGSGIDSGCTIDTSKSNDDKLIIYSSYHCMDENGFYDGWIDFKVIVRPSLSFGAIVDIVGPFSARNGKYAHVKDYLQEVFDHCLNTEIETDDLKGV